MADENVAGHLVRLTAFMAAADLVVFFPTLKYVSSLALGLPPGTPDRIVWEFCQREQWVLLTANRNHDGDDSLNATVLDSWHPGLLPVLTLMNAERFKDGSPYADFVANDAADVLYGLTVGEHRDQPRIHLPRTPFPG